MKIKTRRYYIYYAAKISLYIVRLVPRNISLMAADLMGRAAFKFLDKYRDKTVSNLDEVFSDDHEANLRIARDVFRNLAKNGADWIKMSALSKEGVSRLVTETEGLENLDGALAKGKGVIIAASHFGNWELMPIFIKLRGHYGEVIARRLYFHKYDEFITGLRRRFGVPIIYRDESPKKILKVLKDGGILGILADQDVDSIDGVFVDFFGKPAYTPTAPVKLGMATGAPLIPAFMIRKNDNTFKLVVEKPITIPGEKGSEEEVKKYTQAWTDVLEKYVRRYPEQWVWLHPRWKTKPGVEAPALARGK